MHDTLQTNLHKDSQYSP